MPKLPRAEGRRTFGDDPEAYQAARPDYPDALYQTLVTRCGLAPNTSVFEIGPGTGLATRRLLTLGANPLRALEPDPRLATYLREAIPDAALHIDATPFENANLPPASFDLGIAATSFHWVNQRGGLAKVHKTLKPGGWWAMWWTHFGNDTPDAFHAATTHLFAAAQPNPKPGFDRDTQARLNDLAKAGFIDAQAHVWHWTQTYDTQGVVALYATFSPVKALTPSQRADFLTSLARITEQKFGGHIERPLTTTLYTAQK